MLLSLLLSAGPHDLTRPSFPKMLGELGDGHPQRPRCRDRVCVLAYFIRQPNALRRVRETAGGAVAGGSPVSEPFHMITLRMMALVISCYREF